MADSSCIVGRVRQLVFAAGIVAVAWWLALPVVQSAEEATGASAASMMRTAHAGRGEWTNFPGFAAHFKASADGASVEGRVTVTSDGKIEVTLPESEKSGSDKFAWVKRSLDSVIGHRLPTGEAITNVEFADDQTTHPHGRLIRSADPKDKSLWRVQGDVLTEVQRFTPDSRFIISVGDVWRNPENKHFPRNFVVTTWEVPSGRIKSARQVYTDWTRVGNLDLPSRHLAITNKSDGTTVTHQIEFSHYKIPVAAAKAR